LFLGTPAINKKRKFILSFNIMETRRFKKLDINLPRQPIVNQRPWLIAGFLLAIAFLIATVLLYLSN
jgi:hypothetical protein